MSLDTTAPQTSAAKTASKLSKKANGVADKADDKITEIARRAESAARRAEAVLHDGMDTLRVQTRNYADQAVERIERAQTVVSERVREKPITGVLAAAGVGLIIGMLLSGRRH
jgi:ElaB/YqjD/DUF883 family membrane-anchored ribosome-binding protein